MMILLLALSAIAIVLLLLVRPLEDEGRYGCAGWSMSLGLVSALLLFVALLSAYFEPLETRAEIKRFKAIESAVNAARENGEVLENASLQRDIIEANTWLAGKQYYNNTVWGPWVPDEVDALQPLK